MKINFPILDEPLEISGGTILAVENVTVFSNLVRQLYSYTEESELKLFDKKFDVNSSSMLKLIHADLESQLNEKPEVKSMIENLADTITELIAYECLENELDLEYDEITILELIKALGVKIETQSDTIFEKCFEILQIYNYLSKKKLLIFVNSGAYLTQNEIERLMEYVKLSNQKVLFLEPRKLYDFPQYVLDNDYFLIAENMS